MAPIGWRLSPNEWAFIVGDTEAKIVFAGPGFEGLADQLAGKLPNDPAIVGAAEAWAMIEGAQRTSFEPSDANDAVLQLYTSGTTGNPKGAVLSNRNLFALRKHSSTLDMPSTTWDEDEAVLVAMPGPPIGGHGLCTLALAGGGPEL